MTANMNKLMNLRVAIVKWKDHTSQDAWIDEGEEWNLHSQLHTIVSIGWLKHEDDEKVVLVSAVDTERPAFSCIQTIGKALIVEMKVGGKKRGADGKRKRPEKAAPDSGTGPAVPA